MLIYQLLTSIWNTSENVIVGLGFEKKNRAQRNRRIRERQNNIIILLYHGEIVEKIIRVRLKLAPCWW